MARRVIRRNARSGTGHAGRDATPKQEPRPLLVVGRIMELARHSTITLPMDRYAHVGIHDTAAAVSRLTLPLSVERPIATAAGMVKAYVPSDVPVGGCQGGEMGESMIQTTCRTTAKTPAIPSYLSERAGFEPAVVFYPHAVFAKRMRREMGHSAIAASSLLI
jgi:hypothetical protein